MNSVVRPIINEKVVKYMGLINSTSVYCLRTNKFHFSVTFSLKMDLTVLFTHLKIILLQCFQFSVFSFSKISSIQTDPQYLIKQEFYVGTFFQLVCSFCVHSRYIHNRLGCDLWFWMNIYWVPNNKTILSIYIFLEEKKALVGS